MRTLLYLVVFSVALLSLVSAFSLLREFDDELLLPHVGRARRDAALFEESADLVKTAAGSGHEEEGSGERVSRDAEVKEASGEEPKTAIDESKKEKVRARRDDVLVASGQDPVVEGSGEEAAAKKPSVRRRRSAAEAEEQVGEGSGQEGSGQEA